VLARIAGTSEYHLRRMFSALAGIPLSEYIRRRRLTKAANEVLSGRGSLLDIAVRWGYGSNEAFAAIYKSQKEFRDRNYLYHQYADFQYDGMMLQLLRKV